MRSALAIPARMLALVAALVLAPSSASPQQTRELNGIALVIGQSAYAHLEPLANPANDARAVSGLLDAFGFDTRVVDDRDAARLKRDIERFIEDAADADVALLYYSGHGIEAGGENFLIPVDADLSALDDAGDRLVPLSRIIDQLRASVPVTIVLLDACRTNPFPPGAQITIAAGEAPVPIGASGLGVPRGAMGVRTGSTPASEDLGAVIGFAAEPGEPALDGVAGQNSPYAAALLRHFSAIDGQEFGTVMRMVTEEVYLKTRTRQRPWVNESLRRLIYLGVAPQTEAGDEGIITSERRKLLVTIADLPSSERQQVETIADADNVSLDALYAALVELSETNPDADPTELDRRLRGQAETIAKLAAERQALQADDPEIVRLAALADTALADGAIDASRIFLDRAVARVVQTRSTLDDLEAQLKERRLADAQIYARRAATQSLAFNFAAAASDYAEAFALAERWDRYRAWEYKWWEASAWHSHGEMRGDNAALARGIALYDQALTFVPREQSPADWAETIDARATSLLTLGERDGSIERLEQAVAAYRSELEVRTRKSLPVAWAQGQNNLGNALTSLANRTGETAHFEAALTAYRAALEELSRETTPGDWATTQLNLGVVLLQLGEAEDGTVRLEESVAAYRAALTVMTREKAPLYWATIQNNLGNVLTEIGSRETESTRLEEAVAAFDAAMEEFTRELAPVDWAMTQHNRAGVLRDLGARAADPALLDEAIAGANAALAIRTRGDTPVAWAETQLTLANALTARSRLEDVSEDPVRLRDAIAAYRGALDVFVRDEAPHRWALIHGNLGVALRLLGVRMMDTAPMEEAIAVYEAALTVYSREDEPLDWAFVQYNLGAAQLSLGLVEDGTARLEQSLVTMQGAIDVFAKAGAESYVAGIRENMAIAEQFIAERKAEAAPQGPLPSP